MVSEKGEDSQNGKGRTRLEEGGGMRGAMKEKLYDL